MQRPGPISIASAGDRSRWINPAGGFPGMASADASISRIILLFRKYPRFCEMHVCHGLMGENTRENTKKSCAAKMRPWNSAGPDDSFLYSEKRKRQKQFSHRNSLCALVVLRKKGVVISNLFFDGFQLLLQGVDLAGSDLLWRLMISRRTERVASPSWQKQGSRGFGRCSCPCRAGRR